MLDELAGCGLWPAVLVADTGYGANADFRHGLDERGLAWVLQAKGEMTAHGQEAMPNTAGSAPGRCPTIAPGPCHCADTYWPRVAAAVGP